MEMLSVKQVAELKGCGERNIKKLVLQNKLAFEVSQNDRNRKKYLIPLTALDIKLQAKYHKQQSAAVAPISIASTKVEAKPLDRYSAEERKEIAFWIDTVEKWLEYRNKPTVTSKAEVDKNYVAMLKLENPELSISVDTLYRRLNAYKSDDLDGLIDSRGKWKKGQSRVLEPMWETFLYYFLDEAQHPITKCYEYMKLSMKEDFPELYERIPHDASFRRRIDADLSMQLKILGRQGEKAYRDACGLYIRRVYDEMNSNDYWIGDTHTLDVQSRAEDGSIHRLYLSAFMDARSGVFVGWHISTSPSSQTTLLALRHGILRNNIPSNIYVDNGREFLTHDVGGLGHRKRKPKDGIEKFEPPPIFKRLGVKMTNAIVKNAKAKTIERRFKDFKDQISRTFSTYTGGNITERPECLKARIKNGEVIIDSELIEQVNNLIEFYMNYEEYSGAVKADCGKRKIDVYNEHLTTVRRASDADLNLMLMRSSRVQTVGRRGVHLDINGERFDYFNAEMLNTTMGKQVYFRYDPDDISEIRLYDTKDRFIMNVLADDKTVAKYGASKDDIRTAQQIVRRAERSDKDKLNAIRTLGKKSARELVLAQSMENRINPAAPANPKVINIHRANEEPLLKVVNSSYPDLDIMTANALKRQEEQR